MIELSPRLIGSSTDPAGSQGALGHSFGAAGSAMKNAKNPSSQRPLAHLQVSCSPPWRPKEGCLSWEQFQHNQSRIRSNWQSTGEAGAPREGEGLLLCGQLELGDACSA